MRLADPARLEAIERLGVLDETTDAELDRLTRLAVDVVGAPISLVSIVLPSTQIFKSSIGLDEPWARAREVPLSHSFCQHAVISGEPLVIEDARSHPLVRDNAAIEDMNIVAYAGVPLRTSDGQFLGSFCVCDTKPREWTNREIGMLRELADAAAAYIELRAAPAGGADAPTPRPLQAVAIRRDSSTGLNIAALARRTGVAPDTLRKWEQRYGIIRPTRTSGGQRRYSYRDVARVEWLKARLDEGYRIGEAATLLGNGESPPAQTARALREAILQATDRSDAEEVQRLLDHAFATGGKVEATLRDVVEPVLERVGENWASGRFTVAQEHLVSAAVRARIERLAADARGGVRGVAVLACAPGERHELGLLMLALLLRADGWQVAYLGADTPLGDAFALAEQLRARAVCISVAMPERASSLEDALRPHVNGTPVILGGAGATPELAKRVGARYVAGDVRAAVKALRKLGE